MLGVVLWFKGWLWGVCLLLVLSCFVLRFLTFDAGFV